MRQTASHENSRTREFCVLKAQQRLSRFKAREYVKSLVERKIHTLVQRLALNKYMIEQYERNIEALLKENETIEKKLGEMKR